MVQNNKHKNIAYELTKKNLYLCYVHIDNSKTNVYI